MYEEGKWGFIDKKGDLVIEPQFDQVGLFSHELANVCLNENWGFIDKSGSVVIEPRFNDANEFRESLAGTQSTNGLWGFIDKQGTYLIEPKFWDVWKFDEGIAIVWVNEETNALINTRGEFTGAFFGEILFY